MLKTFAFIASMAGIIGSIACGQSDPGITTAVKSKFAADDTVKAYQIDVDTSNRVVTLSGVVETTVAKEQALTLARQTDGVHDVVDHLTVDPQAVATTGDVREEASAAAERTGAAITDAAVTTAVKTKFLADTAVSGLKIDVDTTDGVVTLNGRVNTKAEAERATSLARESGGVKRVVSNLRIGS
jgi:hyperosmotically inducible periplasmic protein